MSTVYADNPAHNKWRAGADQKELASFSRAPTLGLNRLGPDPMLALAASINRLCDLLEPREVVDP